MATTYSDPGRVREATAEILGRYKIHTTSDEQRRAVRKFLSLVPPVVSPLRRGLVVDPCWVSIAISYRNCGWVVEPLYSVDKGMLWGDEPRIG